MSSLLGDYVTPVPAQQRLGPRWYTGSADAIFQSMNLIVDEKPEYIVVFGADHVYRMDPSQMVAAHIRSGADVTVAGIRVPRSEAFAFGCIDADASGRITRFLEKPKDPPGTPDDPDVTFASMGNYVFTTDALVQALRADAADSDSDHDMGGDIIPAFVAKDTAYVYDFKDNDVPGATERDKGYWRDVGTLDAFYDAHMDLVSVHPVFNLYNRRCAGCIISGATVTRSVLSSDVFIEAGAVVEDSVLMPGVRVGKGAVVRRAILDKNVVIADGQQIGVDLDADRAQYSVSSGGVVAVGKGITVGGTDG